MLPMGSIFILLIVARFNTWFPSTRESYYTVQNLICDDTDASILSVGVHLLLIV